MEAGEEYMESVNNFENEDYLGYETNQGYEDYIGYDNNQNFEDYQKKGVGIHFSLRFV